MPTTPKSTTPTTEPPGSVTAADQVFRRLATYATQGAPKKEAHASRPPGKVRHVAE